MATDIVGSLFGVNPAAYQQAQQARGYNQDYQAVQLDPLQQANLALRQGGRGLGQAAGSLLGIEDPELAKASMAKQLSSQFDITSAEGLRQYANALAQNGAPDLAQMAIKRADEMVTTNITQNLNIKKAQAEGTSTEWIGVPGQPELKQQAIVDRVNNTVTPIGAPISVFSNKTNVNVDARGESEFVKQMGKNDANTVTAAMTTRESALNTVKSIDKLASLDKQELYSGTGATARVAVGNFLDTLGLASKEDAKRIANSQQYDKVAGDVILQTLGGKLGAGFSNEDRKFIAGLVPQLATNPEARKQLIQYVRNKNMDIVKETSRLEQYAREKKGLGGFEYTLPRETIAPASALPKENPYEAEAKRRGLIQ